MFEYSEEFPEKCTAAAFDSSTEALATWLANANKFECFPKNSIPDPRSLPKQANDSDCGIFALVTAEAVAMRKQVRSTCQCQCCHGTVPVIASTASGGSSELETLAGDTGDGEQYIDIEASASMATRVRIHDCLVAAAANRNAGIYALSLASSRSTLQLDVSQTSTQLRSYLCCACTSRQ
jgi:hypothetical protein